MAGNDTAALVVALSAQLTQFEKDMDSAVGIADRGVRNIEDRFSRLNVGKGIDDLVSSIAKLVALGGLAEVANKLTDVVKSVAQIGEIARTVGLTTDQLQALRFAAVSSGESFEKVDSGMERFNRAISDAARGTGDLYKILRDNHVALTDNQGNLLSINTLLQKFSDLIRNAKNPADALNIAILAFGRQAGPAFVKVFNDSTNAVDEFLKKGQQAGVIIDQAFIERAQRLQKQWDETWLKLKAPMQEFAVLFVDTMKKGFAVLLDDINSLGNAALAAFKRVTGEVSTFQEGLRAVGIEKLKSGQGTPLTDASGFPGQGPPNITISKSAGTTVVTNAQTEAFQKLIDAQRTRIQLLGVEQDSIGKTVGQETAYKTLVELIGRAKQEQIPLDQKRLQQLQDEANRTGEAAQALDDYKRQWAGLNSAVQFAGDQLSDILTGLETKTLSLADAAKQLQTALLRALNSALISGSGPLAGLLGLQSNVAGGTGGLLGALFGGFGGGKAGGGPVSAGTPYVVGENGPELFVPSSSGSIVTNQVNGGGSFGGSQIVVNNYTAADTETKQSRQQGPDGEQVVIDIVRKATVRGDFDSANRGRYGQRPMKSF